MANRNHKIHCSDGLKRSSNNFIYCNIRDIGEKFRIFKSEKNKPETLISCYIEINYRLLKNKRILSS